MAWPFAFFRKETPGHGMQTVRMAVASAGIGGREVARVGMATSSG
jgi:hypothetical protein